ncbi:RICIN domain-containing protein [Teredinibacter franksiae]|uniref:RICIN domain-containing protein n=1 Tax=Teredinibacter franksiae TaxID=2761453 RepID=UPI0016274D41|nr:hypothetical protein [Teredinibacter franksiae]
MYRKSFVGIGALVAVLGFSANLQAATDYPSGYTKCAKDNETFSFSGTRSVVYGKSGEFVYATLTGPANCSASLFPSTSVGTPRYCSYAGSDSGGDTGSAFSGSDFSGGSGRYQIISVYSGKAIDVDNSSQENGATSCSGTT